MRSVLVSTDFVKDNDGNFKALEINTNTNLDIRLDEYPLTNDNFESNFSGFFNYNEFNNFLISNNINKIILIESGTSNNTFFKAFCDKFNFEYELVRVPVGDLTIPDIEDDDSTLIIRVAFDPYAIIDDVYAADNFEYHKLIESESFAPNVYFNNDTQLDTITDYKSPIQEGWPNYMVKSRFPNYIVGDYPSLFAFETQEDLNNLKINLSDTEFLSEFYINSSSVSDSNGRTSFYRSVDLFYGSNIETLNLFTYKKENETSVENEKLIYSSSIDESFKLDRLYSTKFLPLQKVIYSSYYHFDEYDKALSNENTLISFGDIIENQTILKTIDYTNYLSGSLDEDLISDFSLTSSFVESINEVQKDILFTNITASNSEFGEFSWFDATDNKYFTDKHNNNKIEWISANEVEAGDEIFVFNKETNTHTKLTVNDVSYEIKNLQVYTIDLEPEPVFFIEITNEENPTNSSPLFLIQHNLSCIGYACTSGFGECAWASCEGCAKNAPNCVNCGGAAVTTCY